MSAIDPTKQVLSQEHYFGGVSTRVTDADEVALIEQLFANAVTEMPLFLELVKSQPEQIDVVELKPYKATPLLEDNVIRERPITTPSAMDVVLDPGAVVNTRRKMMQEIWEQLQF